MGLRGASPSEELALKSDIDVKNRLRHYRHILFDISLKGIRRDGTATHEMSHYLPPKNLCRRGDLYWDGAIEVTPTGFTKRWAAPLATNRPPQRGSDTAGSQSYTAVRKMWVTTSLPRVPHSVFTGQTTEFAIMPALSRDAATQVFFWRA